MSSVEPAPSLQPSELADDTITTVRRWLEESGRIAPDKSAERLAGVLRDPRGLDFTLGFVDRVVRPEDLRVAARNFEVLSHAVPRFLPWYLRIAIIIGGATWKPSKEPIRSRDDQREALDSFHDEVIDAE